MCARSSSLIHDPYQPSGFIHHNLHHNHDDHNDHGDDNGDHADDDDGHVDDNNDAVKCKVKVRSYM